MPSTARERAYSAAPATRLDFRYLKTFRLYSREGWSRERLKTRNANVHQVLLVVQSDAQFKVLNVGPMYTSNLSYSRALQRRQLQP
eukprot:6060061-Pyramimonas_sp.AAC.3